MSRFSWWRGGVSHLHQASSRPKAPPPSLPTETNVVYVVGQSTSLLSDRDEKKPRGVGRFVRRTSYIPCTNFNKKRLAILPKSHRETCKTPPSPPLAEFFHRNRSSLASPPEGSISLLSPLSSLPIRKTERA